MYTKGIIRLEDQENIFRTILIHHNIDNVFSFGFDPNIKSHEFDERRSMSRKNSLNVKKFKRRGSSTVYHLGSMTSLVVSRDEVKINYNQSFNEIFISRKSFQMDFNFNQKMTIKLFKMSIY